MPTLDFEIGYIKLRNFKGKNVGDNFNEFSSSLDALLLTKPKGLIIDLRQNGGGFIGDALSIADILVDTQSLAYVFNPYKNKFIETNSKTHTLPVQVNDRLKIKTTLPIITLIDNLSASASDLLAGVLQSTGRSLIIGDRSYGKGIAQTPLELSTPFIGTSHVTSFMFFLPDGTSPQKTGITPDIRIVPNDFDAILDQHISETLHRNEIVDDVRMENLPQDISINNRSLAQQIGFTHAAPWKPIWDLSALVSKIKSTLPSENFNSHFHFPHDRELSYAIALFTHFNSDFQSIYGGHAHGQNQLNNATARKHSTRIPTP